MFTSCKHVDIYVCLGIAMSECAVYFSAAQSFFRLIVAWDTQQMHFQFFKSGVKNCPICQTGICRALQICLLWLFSHVHSVIMEYIMAQQLDKNHYLSFRNLIPNFTVVAAVFYSYTAADVFTGVMFTVHDI